MAGKHFKNEDTTGVIGSVDAISDANIQTPRKKNKSVFVSRLLTFLGVVLLLTAAFLFARDFYKYKQLDNAIEEQQTMVQIIDENQPPTIDWAKLKEKYPEVVGWIYIPGTVVNYPIVHTDNNDKYLNTLPDGTYNAGGSIFLDAENIAPGMIDQHTIVYGHHMNNGAMFKRIADMQSKEIFDSVKTIWYITEHKTYELHPAFFYITNGSDATLRTIDFPDRESYDKFFAGRVQEDMPHVANVEEVIKTSDRMLSLSTCNYDVTDGRAELVCSWMDPDKKDEKKSQDTDKKENTEQSENTEQAE